MIELSHTSAIIDHHNPFLFQPSYLADGLKDGSFVESHHDRSDMESSFSQGEGESSNVETDNTWSSYPAHTSWSEDEPQYYQHQASSSSSLQGLPQHQSQQTPQYSQSTSQQPSQTGPVPRRYTIQNAAASSSLAATHTQPYAQAGPLASSSSAMSQTSSLALQSPSVQSTGAPQGCFCAMLGQVCTCPRPRPRFYTMSAADSSSYGNANRTASGTLSDSFSPVHLHSPHGHRRLTGQNLSLEPESVATSGWDRSALYRDEGLTPTSANPHPNTQQPRFSQPGMTQQTASPVVYPSGLTAQSPLAYTGLSYLYDSISLTPDMSSAPPATSQYASPAAMTPNLLFDGADLSGVKTESPEFSTLQLHRHYPQQFASHVEMQSQQQLPQHQHQQQSHQQPRQQHQQHQQQQQHLHHEQQHQHRAIPPSTRSYSGMTTGMPHWASRPSTSGSGYSVDNSIQQISLPSSLRGPSDPYSTAMASTSKTGSFTGYTREHVRSDTTHSQSASSTHNTADESDTGSNLSITPAGLAASSSGASMARFSTDEARWNAIVHRSHAADGHFVYGALTTRIYCRPSCASKRPDRNRVVLFDFPDAPAKAEYAGFRACKRCKPGTPGTADACVLAVGQCLRHITQAALLGESDEVDSTLKRRTLKEYSSDYGVSAFHFHRTLKNVCTLTPGDYSKACHALVLQDEIGMDKKNGAPLTADELQQKLRGWSSRRARRAVGNILPSTYSQGFPGMKMFCIYAAGTSFGNVAVLYSKGEESLSTSLDHIAHPLDTDVYSNMHCTVFTTVIGDDALARVQKRSPYAVRVAEQADWLKSLVEDLAKKGSREVQMPAEVVPWVRRARVWLAVKAALEPKLKSSGKKRSDNTSEGDDEDEAEEEEEEMHP